MRVGDCELSRDRALALLAGYAVSHAGTVRLYDLAGDEDGRPGPDGAARPVNVVALADAGRLVVISAGLAAEDVASLIDVDAVAEFSAVPAMARLQTGNPVTPWIRLRQPCTTGTACAVSARPSGRSCRI